ncbi:GMC family oxidoreductase [Roseomonas gilardii]|uniref:GMC family oxidoreductase n=1 Tax=Roseomonas gilardii TaxID=257708 RepID=UPI0011A8F212|nr:GMC family oxidoreductase [Roseomonas gilardii]
MADIRMPHTDAVVVGFGWTGAIMSKELTEAGLKVVALERGEFRDTYPDGAYPETMDELAYAQRLKLFLSPRQNTVTFRHGIDDQAVPYRQIAGFKPGVGVGGAGLHWSGVHWRVLPEELHLRSRYEERYGPGFIPEDMTIQDHGVRYEDLEPHFDFAEKVFGTSGAAYRVGGKVVNEAQGNIFEADRSSEFPLPPQKVPYQAELFRKAAKEVGLHPFNLPSANASGPYTNPYGCGMGVCNFCGFCSGYACYNYSKASPNVNILPALRRVPHFELRANCEVLRVNLDATGKRATGVTYVTPDGKTVEQPADLVIIGTFAYNNARLLLLSGIGTPYDPRSGEGAVGKNFTWQTMATVRAFFPEGKNINPFIGAGGTGIGLDDFNGDHYDHGPLGFVGGSPVWCNPAGTKPIGGIPVPDGTPQWGAGWKKAVKESYLNVVAFDIHGSNMAYRDCYLDLDPDYRDSYGQPLLRMTFNWHDNDVRMSRYITEQVTAVAKAMNPSSVQVSVKNFGAKADLRSYQTTHLAGGAIMGENPRTSVVNRYLQNWDVHNLFCVGSGAFPQGIGYNPTGMVAALTYWSARAIRGQYLKNPGPLVQA